MGRGKAQRSLELIEASREILRQIQPATVRAICYQLFTRGLISSMDKNSTNRVSRQLVSARETGVIPWEWIVDENRDVEICSTWAGGPRRLRSNGDGRLPQEQVGGAAGSRGAVVGKGHGPLHAGTGARSL